MVNSISRGFPLYKCCKALFDTWRPPFRPIPEVPSGFRKRFPGGQGSDTVCQGNSLFKALYETAMATVKVQRALLVAVHNSTFSHMKDWKIDPAHTERTARTERKVQSL